MNSNGTQWFYIHEFVYNLKGTDPNMRLLAVKLLFTDLNNTDQIYFTSLFDEKKGNSICGTQLFFNNYNNESNETIQMKNLTID